MLERIATFLLPPPAITVRRALGLAALLGLAFGGAEFIGWRIQYLATGLFQTWSNPDMVWMAPLALSLLFVLGALPILAACFLLRRRVSMPLLMGLALVPGFAGLIKSLGTPIHASAAVVLSLGLAVAVLRLMRRFDGAGHVRFDLWAAVGIAFFTLLGAGGLTATTVLEKVAALRATGAPAGATSVLLIILDTVSARSLQLYGYQRPTTPHLAALARRGLVFDEAFATSSWTLPSHASAFTGRTATEHRADWRQPLDTRHPTIAEYLRSRGWATAGFTANLFYTSRISGLSRGFEHYQDYDADLGSLLSSAWLTAQIADASRNSRNASGTLRPTAAEVNEEFLSWLDDNSDRPFFAFLNWFDAHVPYSPHEPFYSRFAAMPAPDSTVDAEGRPVALRSRLRRSRDMYDSSIAYMDERLGELLDHLRARGALDNTLIIVTSDHGEQFGDYGLVDHGNSLYTPLVRIPLVIVPPGSDAPRGRVGGVVSLQDLPATIVAATGNGAGTVFPGESLLDVAAAGARLRVLDDTPAIMAVTPEIGAAQAGPLRFGPARSAVNHGYQLIRYGNGTLELYDIRLDLRKRRNLLAGGVAGRAATRMRDELLGVLARERR